MKEFETPPTDPKAKILYKRALEVHKILRTEASEPPPVTRSFPSEISEKCTHKPVKHNRQVRALISPKNEQKAHFVLKRPPFTSFLSPKAATTKPQPPPVTVKITHTIFNPKESEKGLQKEYFTTHSARKQKQSGNKEKPVRTKGELLKKTGFELKKLLPQPKQRNQQNSVITKEGCSITYGDLVAKITEEINHSRSHGNAAKGEHRKIIKCGGHGGK